MSFAWVSLETVEKLLNSADLPGGIVSASPLQQRQFRKRPNRPTSPWVEHASVITDIPRREVRFNLKERNAFNEEAVRKALKDQGFPQVTLKAERD